MSDSNVLHEKKIDATHKPTPEITSRVAQKSQSFLTKPFKCEKFSGDTTSPACCKTLQLSRSSDECPRKTNRRRSSTVIPQMCCSSKSQSSANRKCLRPATFKYRSKYSPYPATSSVIDSFNGLSISMAGARKNWDDSKDNETCTAKRLKVCEQPASSLKINTKTQMKQTDNFEKLAEKSASSQSKVDATTLEKKPLFSRSSRQKLPIVSSKDKAALFRRRTVSGSSSQVATRCGQEVDNKEKLWKAEPVEQGADDSEVHDLGAYMENYFHMPKQMSSMAERMYA